MSMLIQQKKRGIAGVAIAVLMAAGIQVAPLAYGNANAESGRATALAYAPKTGALYRSDGQVLLRSKDRGRQWVKVPLPQPTTNGRITAVAAAATGEDALYVAGRGLGVLKSIDGGKSWTRVDGGLPSRDVVAFAVHTTRARTLYAVLKGRGVFRSEDGGARWRLVDKGPRAEIRRLVHSNMPGSMQTGWLFAATDAGVYRAMDCFCGFRIAGSLKTKISAVTYDPAQPKRLYVAAAAQVFRSVDGGEDWQPTTSPGRAVVALAHSPSGVLYALLADGQVKQSSNQGEQWK